MNDPDDRDHRDTVHRADRGRDIPTAADGHRDRDREHNEWTDHRDRDREHSEWYGHRDHSAPRGLRDSDTYRAPRPYDRDRERSERYGHRERSEWYGHRDDYYRAPQQRTPLTGVIVAVVAVTVLGVGAGAWSVYSEHKTDSSSSGLPWSNKGDGPSIEVPTVRGRVLGEFEPVGTVYALPNAPSPRAGSRALDAVPWDNPRVVVVHRATQEDAFAEDVEQCLSGTDPATYELTGDDLRCIYEMGHARLGYVLEVVDR